MQVVSGWISICWALPLPHPARRGLFLPHRSSAPKLLALTAMNHSGSFHQLHGTSESRSLKTIETLTAQCLGQSTLNSPSVARRVRRWMDSAAPTSSASTPSATSLQTERAGWQLGFCVQFSWRCTALGVPGIQGLEVSSLQPRFVTGCSEQAAPLLVALLADNESQSGWNDAGDLRGHTERCWKQEA